ncbi:MAG: hypothetical protein IT572_03555, partial [Deltaproteobacteria bacterium]|nr:hypothetical protein [Deltaproteobacteria bacterium]
MGGVIRVKFRKSFALFAAAIGLGLLSGRVWAEKTEISGHRAGAESAPSISEDMEMPETMPSMPGGFTGEDKASTLGPPPEVPMGAGPRLSIEDCVKMALLNNREVRAKDYDMEVAQSKLKEAQPRGIPVFEYEFLSFPAPRDADRAVSSFFEGDVTFGQRGKISLGIPLYTFGKIGIAQ